jgi:TonB family protein
MTTAIGRLVMIGTLAAAAVIVRPSAAEATRCPILVREILPMPDGRSYGATLFSKVQGVADVRLTLYSDAATYAVTIPHLLFDREIQPSSADSTPVGYRAAPVYVSLPQNDSLDAVRADTSSPEGSNPTPCFSQYTRTQHLEAKLNSKYVRPVDVNARLEENMLLELFPRAPLAIAAVLEPNAPLTCREAYASARTVEKAAAYYPQAAYNVGASGTVMISVDLKPSGDADTLAVFKSSGNQSLDLAGLQAAAASKYRPEYFRCKPIGGRYLFVVDFSR